MGEGGAARATMATGYLTLQLEPKLDLGKKTLFILRYFAHVNNNVRTSSRERIKGTFEIGKVQEAYQKQATSSWKHTCPLITSILEG